MTRLSVLLLALTACVESNQECCWCDRDLGCRPADMRLCEEIPTGPTKKYGYVIRARGTCPGLRLP